MLQIEAADGHGQRVLNASLDLGAPELLARVPASGGVCEPIWLRGEGMLRAEYRARVEVDRPAADVRALAAVPLHRLPASRSEEHTSELQSLMRISYAVFCLKKKKIK